ncbi:conjugal transfer protein [Rhizobium rhizosphaerae]|uniref:Conjugal transfer protein n=1 Tax=Xaviernesmea rhizosphaerae TaxID=1672749 RepID=A0A1Q9AKH3_9HYPH|nr:type IV secretion system protein VirB10 [Xaviernesmea rhizosphaerae]OLP55796.1 conjugal transfer protein [Xaviernesmea rhizosphaerae]
MSGDFEEEAGITETVARPRRGRNSGLVPILLGSAALCVLAYAAYVSFGHPQSLGADKEREEFKTASRSTHLHLDPVEPPDEQDNKLVIAPPPVPVEQPTAQPVIVTAPPVDDTAARLAAEEAERARKAEELRQARLRSSMIVVDQGQQGGLPGAFSDPSSPPATGMSADDDPNRRFAAVVSAQDVETVRANRNDRIDALIPQGTMIRGVLETAIQSDLPGMVRAVISTDVYSFDGRRILLPKGTMLTGEYKSGLARGQTRVLIIWTRALRSDGTSVALGSYGTDDLGRSGLNGAVDKHFIERFGAASMLSLVGGVSSFIAGLNTDGSSAPGSSSSSQMGVNAQTEAQQTVSQTMAEMANMALKDSINIPPTIHVNQGRQIMVFVRRDLDFSALYPDPVKEAIHELRNAPGRPRR